MVSVELQLQNPSGLHLRPAGILCKAATKFQSHITITTADGTEANAKSVLSVLSACVKSGDMITLSCDGNDENAALKEHFIRPLLSEYYLLNTICIFIQMIDDPIIFISAPMRMGID